MLTKTLVAMLVVASTTVGIAATASAAPLHERARVETVARGEIRHEPTRIAPPHEVRPIVVRDWANRRFERAPRIEYGPRFGYVAAPTATAITAAVTFDLGDTTGTAIELASTGGATFVQQVSIDYADGRTQVLPVDQELGAQQPSLEVATDGTPIASVQVRAQGAALSVTAV